MIRRASKPDLSKIVTAVARIEWFVYCFDKSASLDILFIIHPNASLRHQNLALFSSWVVETKTHFVGLGALDISQKMPQDKMGLRFHTSFLLPPPHCSLGDFFVNSSTTLDTNFFRDASTRTAKWDFFNWRRFWRPRRQKFNMISKNTLFKRVFGLSVLKTPLSLSFFKSASSMGGLCCTFASPSFFS